MELVMRIIVGFFRFWYDFIVGDAWEIAAGVAVVLVAGVYLTRRALLPGTLLPYLVGGLVVLVLTGSVLREFRKKIHS